MRLKIIFFGFVANISAIKAQESVNPSGGNYSGSSGGVTYSIGQVFYETFSSPNNASILQGVQHSYEISETLGSNAFEISLNLKVYPNPTTDELNLNLDLSDFAKYSYELYSNSGKLLSAKKINSKITSINMVSYPASIYLLKVIKDNGRVKVFKILKK